MTGHPPPAGFLHRLIPPLCVAMLCWPGQAVAQDDSADARRVTAAWTFLPGLFTPKEAGPPDGFFGSLAQEIGRRLDLTVDFQEVPYVEEVIARQRDGRSEMLAGAARTPALAEHNLFSDVVATSSVYLFVRSNADANFDPRSLSNARLGVVDRAAGSTLAQTLGRGNSVTVFPDGNAALGALLFAEIDGLIALYPGVMGALRAQGLETRVRRVEPALQETEHVVSLHRSRAELMPEVNAALNEMRADGTLEALRRHWNMAVPAPPPEVLSAGVADFPPYSLRNEDGSFSGFGVEALRDLAARAGLQVKFEAISFEAFGEGPGSDSFDLLPLAGRSPERQQRMDFTLPLNSVPFSAFVSDDSQLQPQGLSDLAGLSVGILASSVLRSQIPDQDGMRLVTFESDTALMTALAAQEIDLSIYLDVTGRQVVEDLGLTDRIKVVNSTIHTNVGAVALRLGLAETREALNAVLPGYLSSPAYEALRREWFGTPRFWTPARVLYAELAAGFLAAITIAAFLLLSELGRRKAERLTAQTRVANARLATILGAARSSILGLSRDGQVYVANPSARDVLGVGDADTPFPWPDSVRFLDREDLAPLEASHDPIQRALAGQTLKGEVALMSAPGTETAHYMRVSSAPVTEDESEVGTVVILDDVSEHERNRQQLERASRLDALGQLTGGVAHDFNNLLATIEYAVQLASPGASDRTRNYLDTALATVQRGTALTKRLLAFARKQPGLSKSVSVRQVLDDLSDLAGPTIEETISLEFVNEEEEELWVYCDIGQLENALLNLILNSRDAILRSDRGDRITVTIRSSMHTRRDDLDLPGAGDAMITEGLQAEDASTQLQADGRLYRYVEFSVTDNGPGMTEEVRKRAVDPFFTTRETNSGTGLGLSIVYGFIQQSGGELRIYSELDKGTTVRLLLPRGTPDGGREAPMVPDKQLVGHGETILVVEDDLTLMSMIRDVLESTGYRVLTSASGKAALELIDAGTHFDLLLTDIVMPGGIGGFELARQLRARRADMPVVYMSGYTGVAASDMGEVVAPMIQKPCPQAELARVLRQQLDSATEA